MTTPVCVGHLPTVNRAATDGEGTRGFRRVACKLLLSGYLGAGQGDRDARQWIDSPPAHLLAELVDLPYWPPRRDQFYSFVELQRRAAQLNGAADTH